MNTAVTTGQLSPAAIWSWQWAQSLAEGAPGLVLLHGERARTGLAGWEPVHRLAVAMTRHPIHASVEGTGLFTGAPAVAYALHTTAHPAYRTALATLDLAIDALIGRRLAAAHRRIDTGQLAQAREYDLIGGLTGLGVYLLHRHGDHPLLRAILRYLVRLTDPIRRDRQRLPGWWAAGSPDRRTSPRWAGGHGGFGMAHGISGPLALLSTAMRHGVTVHRHHDAIATICAWLDQHHHGHGRTAWWPEVLDRGELRTGARALAGPHRPSWCYGTPGIARAQHLAALATGDQTRAQAAEQALLGCLTDDQQLARLADPGLCHGRAGLIHTVRSAARDATGSDLAAAVHAAAGRMQRQRLDHGRPAGAGLLEGTAGPALVDLAPPGSLPPEHTRWDNCLLVR